MSYILDLETYVKTKGYFTEADLNNMQFEIGERVLENGGKEDIYRDLLEGKIYEKEGGYEAFTAWRDEVILERDEQEILNEIVD